MAVSLPEPHPELLEKARRAYRLAVQFDRRVDERWESREDELQKADEFSRVRVAHENDTYRAELYVKYARAVYLTVTVGDWEWPSWAIDSLSQKAIEQSRDRDLLRARKAMAETLILFDKLKPRDS